MAYEPLYIAKFNSQTLNDIEVQFQKKTTAIGLYPIEVAKELINVVEAEPTESFTIPPALPRPSITFTQGVSGGKKYLSILIGPVVHTGDTFNIRYNHPIWGGDDYSVYVSYIATVSDTPSTVAQTLVNLINAQVTGYPTTVQYLAPNKINIVNEQAKRKSYAFDGVVVSATQTPQETRPRATEYKPFLSTNTNIYKDNSFYLFVNENYTPIVSADANGAGNNPTITISYVLPTSPTKLYIITIGPDIKPGNIYTITVQGATMTFTVPEFQSAQPIEVLDVEVKKTGEGLWDCLVQTEAQIDLLLTPKDALDYTTFLTDSYDEWRVQISINKINILTGFILPEEGQAQFKDKPYIISLKVTDGIGLLKQADFVKLSGERYTQCEDPLNLLITYIAACLKQTNIDLPIRVWCSIYNSGMVDRDADITRDMFDQIKLSSRTFLKDESTHVSAYDALLIMLENNFRVYQSDGFWMIHRIDEFGNDVQGTFYTDYSSEGVRIGGNQLLDDNCLVGRYNKVVPINLPLRLTALTNKSVKTTFSYEQFPSYVPNQSLTEYGAVKLYIQTGGRPGSEPSVGYEMICWQQFHKDFHNEESRTLKPAYIRIDRTGSEFEIDRFYTVPVDRTATTKVYIRNMNDDFKVYKGDKLTVTVDWKAKFKETVEENGLGGEVDRGEIKLLQVILVKRGGVKTNEADCYSMKSDGTWVKGDDTQFSGVAEGSAVNISDPGDLATDWQGTGAQVGKVPADGTVYIILSAPPNLSPTNEVWFKNISINYEPQGLYNVTLRAKNDYWISAQDKNIKDNIADTVRMSDVPITSVRGAMYKLDGTLTPTSWYKQGLKTVLYHYKELQNKAKWMQSFRRIERVQGQFHGLEYSPQNNPNKTSPLGFHQRFTLVDFDVNKTFVLVPPLTFNLKTGITDATFVEINKEKVPEHTYNYKHNY